MSNVAGRTWQVGKPSALVPVSNGCDRFCAYCIVPLARGREISRLNLDILNDVRIAVDGGAKEIWLLGQTVNSYKNGGVKFHDLLLPWLMTFPAIFGSVSLRPIRKIFPTNL